jgi:lycopene cyclase domain-containing protein
MHLMHLTYLALLAACFVGTLPLEFVLHTRVYARWRQLVATLVPIVVIFGAWDLLAIHQGTWRYNSRYLVGVTLPGHLPLEELLFFLVIPTCSILAFEAVRVRKPEWFE